MLPDEVDALYHQMQHLGSKWADLHAEAELLEESKKCVLASITLHYMNEGDSKSSGEAKVRRSASFASRPQIQRRGSVPESMSPRDPSPAH